PFFIASTNFSIIVIVTSPLLKPFRTKQSVDTAVNEQNYAVDTACQRRSQKYYSVGYFACVQKFLPAVSCRNRNKQSGFHLFFRHALSHRCSRVSRCYRID